MVGCILQSECRHLLPLLDVTLLDVGGILETELEASVEWRSMLSRNESTSSNSELSWLMLFKDELRSGVFLVVTQSAMFSKVFEL